MRTIKFRAKRIGNGQWIYGNLIIVGSMVHGSRSTAIQVDDGGDICHSHVVDPATVGQFTGLKDKNGVDIYEGDIDADGFVFQYSVGMGSWYRMKNRQGFGWHEQSCTHAGTRLPFEVIGNIHDNPDLIETKL